MQSFTRDGYLRRSPLSKSPHAGIKGDRGDLPGPRAPKRCQTPPQPPFAKGGGYHVPQWVA